MADEMPHNVAFHQNATVYGDKNIVQGQKYITNFD